MMDLHPRSIGPAVTGGRIHDIEAVPSDPSTIYVAAASGRAVEDHQPRPDLGQRLRHHGGEHLRRRGAGTFDPGHRVRGHRRAEQPPEHVVRQRRLPLRRRRHELALPRARRDPAHRQGGDPPHQPRHRLRGRPGQPVGTLPRARRLPHPRRRARRGRRSSTSTTTPARWTWSWTPPTPTCSTPPCTSVQRRAWGFNGGGPGSGIYKTTDGGDHLDGAHQRHPRRRQGPHRPGHRPIRSEGAHGPHRVRRPRRAGHVPQRRRRRHLDPGQRPGLAPHVLLRDLHRPHRREHRLRAGHRLQGQPRRRADVEPVRVDADVRRGRAPGRPRPLDRPQRPEARLPGERRRLLGELRPGRRTSGRSTTSSWRSSTASAADMRDPYWVYGGLQDNHSFMGPSRTRRWAGILNDDWMEVGLQRRHVLAGRPPGLPLRLRQRQTRAATSASTTSPATTCPSARSRPRARSTASTGRRPPCSPGTTPTSSTWRGTASSSPGTGARAGAGPRT